MRYVHPPFARLAFPLALLGALGLVHCGSDDHPKGSGGRGGTSGSSGAGSAGKASGGASGSGVTGGRAGSAGSAGSSAGTGGGGTAGASANGGKAGSAGIGGSAGRGGSAGSAGSDAPGGEGGLTGEGGESMGGQGGDSGGEPQNVNHSILIGSFSPLPAYSGSSFEGQAILVRTVAGDTRVSIQVTGLTPSTAHESHVHNQPCSALAGTHYLKDAAAAGGVANEIWLPFTSDVNGVGVAEAVVAGHLTRGDALSIVVHDPSGGAKMVCADLTIGSDATLTARGTFAPFAAAATMDQTIAGTAELVRSSSGTGITLNVTGLDAAAGYASHVHQQPCAVLDASGHYKIDPTVGTTMSNNELWPDLGDTSDGAASGLTSFGHRARLDGQSIVIHRSAGGGMTPKVACANLTVDAYPSVVVDGSSQLLPAATPNYTNLDADAELERKLDGTTRVHIAATGLMANVMYPVHVHNLPCSVQNGGGHYLRDLGMAAAEANEIWVPLTAGSNGSGEASAVVSHIARADARSMVIHDPNSTPAPNARLACIDLAPQ